MMKIDYKSEKNKRKITIISAVAMMMMGCVQGPYLIIEQT